MYCHRTDSLRIVAERLPYPFPRTILSSGSQNLLHVPGSESRGNTFERIEHGCDLDEIRAGESRRMAMEGQAPILKKSRWLLLKREENLKTEQRFRLRDLLRYNLRTVRAYLLKEAFQQLWDYNSVTWAGKFLDVPSGDALPHRADEENRPLATRAPRADPELLPGQKDDFQRDGGGSE